MPFLPQVFARQAGSAPPAPGGPQPTPAAAAPSGPPAAWGPPPASGPPAAGPPPAVGPPAPAGNGNQQQKPPSAGPSQQQQQHCWKDPKTGSQVCVWEQDAAKNETKVHDEGGVHDYHESQSSKENDAIVGKVPGTDPAVFLPPGFRPSRASASALEGGQTTYPAGVSSGNSASSSASNVGSPYTSTSAPQSAQTTYPAGASSGNSGSWSGQSQQGKAPDSSSVSEPTASQTSLPTNVLGAGSYLSTAWEWPATSGRPPIPSGGWAGMGWPSQVSSSGPGTAAPSSADSAVSFAPAQPTEPFYLPSEPMGEPSTPTGAVAPPSSSSGIPSSPAQPTDSSVEPSNSAQQWSGTMQDPNNDDATTVFEGKKSDQETGSHDVHSSPGDFSDHSDSHDKEDRVWKAHTGYPDGAGSDMDIHRSSDENKETLHQDKNGTHNLYQTEDDRDSNHIAWSSHPGYGWHPGSGSGQDGPKGLEIQQEEEKHAAEEEHSGKGYYDFESQSETVGSTSVQVGGEDAWEDADEAFAGMRGLIPRSNEGDVVVVVVPAVQGGEPEGEGALATKPVQVVEVVPQQIGRVQLPPLNHTLNGTSASDNSALFPSMVPGKNCTGSSCVSDKMACDAACERNGMTTLIVLGSFFVMVLAGVLCCLLSQLKTSEQRAQRQTSDILEDGRGSRKVGE
ncbi:hypothetical protein KC360_g1224 [Hortaea werneckii]|nr:hypothetical protein KC325_g1884 [Hortaea werneckii]KAI6998505.1 hypothetical protein KC359_g2365 [Hortaea werneckii]KAI7149206.1 hypothetical protein KC344_g1238 [Hortaea werneckii]KAI7178975.1 hypothetical protein KC360_g1224 [Hortaea werneckii]